MINITNKQNLIIDLRVGEGETRIKGKGISMSKRIIKSMAEWTIYALVFMAIVWGTPQALARVLHTEYPIAAITSSSMWPALKQGDIVLIKGVSDKNEIALGEIVVYENEKGFTIHRVVQLNDNTLVTKGDANNVEDQPVTYDKLVGKTVSWQDKILHVPYLGKLSQIFQ